MANSHNLIILEEGSGAQLLVAIIPWMKFVSLSNRVTEVL